MFDEMSPNNLDGVPEDTRAQPKKIIGLLIIAFIVIVAIIGLLVFVINKNKNKITEPAPENASTTFSVLPVEKEDATNTASSSNFNELEKYTFSNFYQEPAPVPDFSFKDYSLPLNIKIDTLNYYDISRKINLDKYVETINADGFSEMLNPDSEKIKDFYSAYSWLSEKEIPLLITSDFLMHYHQNVNKQVFKDIEESLFYDNLWRISKSLYESSKNRYESRLAAIGNINDPILEGERLATAYFAVALKLLEPDAKQIDPENKDVTRFTKSEALKFSFNILPYLQSDAGQEVAFIKSAYETKKSPVLLYNKNYTEFVVPEEYNRNAKLHNFYLASTWLNSVFPIIAKDASCPNCLLDKDDSRLSLIATTFITKDFSSDQELKNRWALIYKLISYFKGLRDDLTYLNYDAAMKKLFGDDYNPELLFTETNPDAEANLNKLRTELVAFSFSSSLGAYDKNTEKPALGFKLLADYYWPNNYIFNRLTGEAVGPYLGNKEASSNTICKYTKIRCNGFALDVISLASDKLGVSDYWRENTNFKNYVNQKNSLMTEINNSLIWHNNNFWSTLGVVKNIFETNNSQMQIYSQTDNWQKRLISSATAAWIDLQLPLKKISIMDVSKKVGLSNEVAFNENYYIEPNYSLVQKLIADNEMIYGMMDALGVTKEVPSAHISLKEENNKLRQIATLIKKELNGEALNSDDRDFISVFARQYKIAQVSSDAIFLETGGFRLNETINIKLMALVYELNSGKYIAIGPIFSHEEKRY